MPILWGKNIDVNEQTALLENFSSYLEVSMMVTIEKFKSIFILQKSGWLCEARDFLIKVLPEVCEEVEQFLVKSKLMNPPNWKLFLKDRLEIARQAGQSIYDYHDKCFHVCASQYQQQYQATYEHELAKQEGLGFGIISSSLAAHLVYAAQSARKEVENEKKASDAADRIMSSSLSPVDKAAQMTIELYREKFDPFVVDFIIGFYSDIEKLIYDGLDVDKSVLDSKKVLSNEKLKGISVDNHRSLIVDSLCEYPFNGDALVWAVRCHDIDEDLIKFCTHNSLLLPKYLNVIKNSSIEFLNKQKEKADLYNRDPLTDEIIHFMHSLKLFLLDEEMQGNSTYEEIVNDVYGELIDVLCRKFDIYFRIINNDSSLHNYARDHKSINLSKKDYELLQRYNLIFGIKKINIVIEKLPAEVDEFNVSLASLCNKVEDSYQHHKESERQRMKREAERVEKERLAEEQRKAEEQERKELAKQKTKKLLLISLVSVVVFVIFVIILIKLIIPSVAYSKAVSLMEKGELYEAYTKFSELGSFKDSEQKLIELSDIQPNLPFMVGDVGDSVTLGTYEQDNNISNGKEPIEWIILTKENNRVLVVSKLCLDNKSFYSNTSSINTWETSTIRTWLNGEFMNSFDIKERDSILYSEVENETYISNSDSGRDTQDYIFLLSIDEALTYLSSNHLLDSSFSPKADIDDYYGYWWLRTKGKGDYAVMYVDKKGDIIRKGIAYTYELGIRPAMWIDISTDNPQHSNDAADAVENKYNHALDLYNEGKYEEAISIFKDLDNYKDSKALAKEASSKFALVYENKGNIEKAVIWYIDAGNTSKANSLMYEYVLTHKKNTNELTYDYLVHLKGINYKDTNSIYAELYKITMKIYIQNYDLYYVIEGGPPKGEVTIRLVNESRWYRSNEFSVSEDYVFTSLAEKEGVVQVRDVKLFYAYIHRITVYDETTGEMLDQIIYESEM